MDPNLFHLDWERLAEVLAAIAVLAFILERALALVFEHRLFIKYFDQSGLKEVIALVVCGLVCLNWNFDSLSMVLLTDHTTRLGEVLTGAVIAGGSKASLKLFHDVLNIRSSAHEQVHPTDPQTKKPQPEPDETARRAL
jgi:hypothetical protein